MTTPPPDKQVAAETLEEISERIARGHFNKDNGRESQFQRLRNDILSALRNERERCAVVALEQRCERGTPWDAACVAIAKAIRQGGERRQ